MPRIVNSAWLMVNGFRKKSNILPTIYPDKGRTNHQPRTKHAFTLIELLVVFGILATLASVILVSTNLARSKGKDARKKQDLQAMSTALIAYYVDHHQYPPADSVSYPQTDYTSDLNLPNWIPELSTYMQKIPKDPAQSSISYMLANAFGLTPKNATRQIATNTKTNKGQVSGVVSAKLGNTNLTPASTGSINQGRLTGTKFTMGANAGTASSMNVDVAAIDASPNNKFVLAIYSDNAGSPGTLIANTSQATLTAAGWQSADIALTSAPTLSANTDYWLMYSTNASGDSLNNLKYDTGGNSSYFTYTLGSLFPVNPTSTAQANRQYAIYVNYSYSTSAVRPTVTASSATSIGNNQVTLNSTVNPNGDATTGWFRYSTTSPGSNCNDTFGTRYPATGGVSFGSGSTAVVIPSPQIVTGLTTGTSYYYCAVASNSSGNSYGSVSVFTTTGSTTSPITFGRTSASGNNDLASNDIFNGTQFSTGTYGGPVNSISVNVGNPSSGGGKQYMLAIYSNDTSTNPDGQPGRLVAYTNPTDFTGVALNTATLTTNLTLTPNTIYWLMYNKNLASKNFNLAKNIAGTFAWNGAYFNSAFGTPPDPAPDTSHGMNAQNSIYSIYVTYIPTLTTPPASSSTPSPSPASGSETWTGSIGSTGACDSKFNTYCYRVSSTKRAFVLWAQLENTSDQDVVATNTNACANSTDFTTSGNTYFGLGKPGGTNGFNYCLKSPPL